MKTSINPQNAQNIVVLTGAGISAESGINTFRAADGLWENHRIEDVATPQAFERDPVLVHQFYNQRRAQLLGGVEPNAAHYALAKFTEQTQANVTVVTQNIDDLHQRAGSDVLAMHGQLLLMRCKVSGRRYQQNNSSDITDRCLCCNQPGNLRPHVVWFGEMPLMMQEIESALSVCDLFVAIGTSGNVYPAAGFAQLAREAGAHTVELNLEAGANQSLFHEQRLGPASRLVPTYFGLSR